MIDCEKPRETVHKGPKGVPAYSVEVIRSVDYELRCCSKHKFRKKKQFSREEKRLVVISRNIEHEKRQVTTYQGTKGNLTSIAFDKLSFLWDLSSREPKFSK